MEINLDIAALQSIAHTGVRRASAFLAIGLQSLSGGAPKSVTMGEHVRIQFMVDPLPEDIARETADNYRAWLTGAALRELDHSLAMFLEQVWSVCRLAELHAKPRPLAFPPDGSFDRQSTAKKLKDVIARTGADAPWAEYFDAFGLARNSLTHGEA